MIAIYKRELRSYFCSFTGWLFIAVNLCFLGLYFQVLNMIMGYPTISYVLESVLFIFLLTAPILTMRTLSEERKNKTDQLLLTAPVSVGGIVMGKFLALETVLLVPTAFMGILPLFLARGGEVQFATSYASLLGFYLYGSLALSVGLFLSSLTESVVIAAVLSFGALFLGYIMTGISSILTSMGTTAFTTVLARILSCFDMVERFQTLSSGYFEVEAVVYYLSAVALALFCTVQSIQKRRYRIAGGGIRLGAYSASGIVLAVALTVAVNLGLNYVPEQYSSFDLTENKRYTLMEETKTFLAGMTEDVTVYVLAEEDEEETDLKKTVERIKDQTGHVKVKYVSPSKNPNFYQQYTTQSPSLGSLIVEGTRRSTVVDYGDIYVYEWNDYTYNYDVTGYDGEGQIISALAFVSTDDLPRFYAVGGHGELALEDRFVKAMEKENISCEQLMLYSVDEIPEDAQGLILNAPTSDFSKEDADKVIAYLEKGGNALIVSTLTEEKMTNFQSILAFYGITDAGGTVVETDREYYYQNPYYLVPMIADSDVTASLKNELVFAPYARGLLYDGEETEINYTPLLTTSDSAFSKSNFNENAGYEKEEGDIDGPFAIALQVKKPAADGGISTAYVMGGESLFTTAADNVAPGNNVKLFAGMIGAMADHESPVTVPVKSLTMTYLVFKQQTLVIVTILCVIVIPLAALVTGLVIWLRRRRK